MGEEKRRKTKRRRMRVRLLRESLPLLVPSRAIMHNRGSSWPVATSTCCTRAESLVGVKLRRRSRGRFPRERSRRVIVKERDQNGRFRVGFSVSRRLGTVSQCHRVTRLSPCISRHSHYIPRMLHTIYIERRIYTSPDEGTIGEEATGRILEIECSSIQLVAEEFLRVCEVMERSAETCIRSTFLLYTFLNIVCNISYECYEWTQVLSSDTDLTATFSQF